MGRPSSTASPPTRLAPTTLIGVSGSRSSPPMASMSFGILEGNFAIASKVRSTVTPTYQMLAGTASSTV